MPKLPLLPLTVLLVRVNVPLLPMPPPPEVAMLPLTVLLVRVNVPLLIMPPPAEELSRSPCRRSLCCW